MLKEWIKKMGQGIIVAGFVFGLIWYIFWGSLVFPVKIIFASFVFGVLIIGYSEIIKILAEINDNLKKCLEKEE